MNPWLSSLVAIVAAYLVGSLSFAVIISRVFGLADPRSYGSKNPGATNVLRSGHRAAAVLTLAFDALKGFVPVMLALAFAPRFGFGETTVAFAGLAAFLGHLWPVFFRFEGGKGVATAAGVFLVMAPAAVAAAFLGFLTALGVTRYVSVASLTAAGILVATAAASHSVPAVLAAAAASAILIVYAHRANVARLLGGTEPKLGARHAEGKQGLKQL